MFTKSGSDLAFDSVRVVEGNFVVDPTSTDVQGDIHMAYVNRESGTTYGKCTIRSHLWSKETMETFRAFLESAEKDFGSIVFKEGGSTVPTGTTSLGAAEGTESPKPKVLGGG